MTQRQYRKNLILMISVAAITATATVAIGPLAGVAAFLLGVVLGAFLGALMLLDRELNEIDERCSRIDEELDQERAARDMLRTQRTVHAEPQAQIMDIFTGKPVA